MISPADDDSRAPHPRRRSSRGVLIVVAMFVLGGAVLWGLFRAPRAKSPPVPSGAAWGVPDRPVRCAWWWVGNSVDAQATATKIRELKPDIVLLNAVESRNLPAVAAALGMEPSYHPNNYARSQNLGGRKSEYGVAVLSSHPLYDGAAIRLERPNTDFAVAATAVVDGKKLLAVSAWLGDDTVSMERIALRDAWLMRGAPPIVIGQVGGLVSGLVEVDEGFQIYGEWRVVRRGKGNGFAWIDLAPPPAPATSPMTAAPRSAAP